VRKSNIPEALQKPLPHRTVPPAAVSTYDIAQKAERLHSYLAYVQLRLRSIRSLVRLSHPPSWGSGEDSQQDAQPRQGKGSKTSFSCGTQYFNDFLHDPLIVASN
jgi:hypothetical protein